MFDQPCPKFTVLFYITDPDTKIMLSMLYNNCSQHSMFVILSTATCSRHYIVTENYTLLGDT